MHKLAANLSMLFTEVPFLARFEHAKLAGFEAVEYLFPYAFEAKAIAHELQTHGLTQALFNFYPGDFDKGERGIAALPDRIDEFKESVEQAIGYATQLKCKKLHVMAGIIDHRIDHQTHVETFIQNLRYAADKVAKYDITLMIEPLNHRDVPGYFIVNQRKAVELINLIQRDNVKLQFDLYHAQIMDGDITRLLNEVAPFIGHIQIASVPDRHEPHLGELNIQHFFNTLKSLKYSGFIGCEYHPKGQTLAGLDWVQTHYLA